MHSFRSKTHILGICTPFRCSKMSVLFHTTYFTSKTHVSGGFIPFRCQTLCKNQYRGTFNARVCASRTVSCFFCSKHAQSTTFGLKFMFWMVSLHFVATPDPLRKLA